MGMLRDQEVAVILEVFLLCRHQELLLITQEQSVNTPKAQHSPLNR
jgi:hypothetical protein